MLEIAALCWDRDNMKKSMPSMPIQASVIQPRRHLWLPQPWPSLISLGTQTK